MNDSKVEEILTMRSREAGLTKLAAMMVNHWMDVGLFQSCLNCCDWDYDKCQKFKMRPPDKVIVCGCEFHSDIPF